MKYTYTFAPYMLVVYGENNADGYLTYRNNTFSFNRANISADGIISFNFTVPNLESIGAGMRYTTPNPLNDDETYLNGFVNSFYSPIVTPAISQDSSVTFTVRFDPKNPQNTNFTFSGTKQEFTSDFTDIYGNPLTVTPKAGACLVLERCAVYRHKGGVKSEYYLGLSGSFIVEKDVNLLCGDTGTEYISPAGEPLTVSFTPGNNAYIADGYKNHTTCAYLSFPQGGDYCCQSAESPFFTPSDISSGVFQYLPLKLTVLPNTAAPMFPVTDTELERLLSAARYDVFTRENLLGSSNETIYAVTKNGLLATVVGGSLEKVVFAVDSKDQIELEITDALRFELQSAQPKFIFSAYPNKLKHSQFTLADWVFNFSETDWQKNTRIILKYSDDMSILQWLSKDEVFQDSIKRTQNADGSIAPHYKEFTELINNPSFTGMLILNCKAKYAGGGDAAEFINAVRGTVTAHHIIVRAGNITSCENSNSGLSLQPSLINVVVDYSDEDAQITYDYDNPPADYDFATVAILSVIQRSLTVSLKTTSELLVNKLFDCASKLSEKSGGGNALIIDGELRERSGVSTFEYALRCEGEYTLAASLLDSVVIDNVRLSHSVFFLSGSLGFRLLQDTPDLFGYGGDTPLKFSNLQIRKTTDAQVYLIDYAHIALRQSDSRAASFPNVFPAAASTLSRETKTPAELKIVSLGTPITNSNLSEFSAPWWRISYPLMIGNLGKLSGNIDFSLNIVFCWRGESFYAGVIPPGGVLGSGLAMSGVLNFTAKAITLAPEVDMDGQVAAYNLGFTSIALKLLKFTIPPSGGVGLLVRGGEDGIAWKAVYGEEG
ncbi:MAG: hypothetical protein LBC86_00035 [Oscillospiraceae bacterium]|jgi:hypothetical protein|nr:hypothetical protein [Oscillospiraceae bacterium]